jgi:hypothetical protein
VKRIWVVICDGMVYLHKRFGEICRFIIDLKKCQLESYIATTSLRFTLKLDSFPAFEFDVIDTTDALCWKLSFYTAWKALREGEFNFRNLMDKMRKLKRESKDEIVDDDLSVDSSLQSLGSLRSLGSKGSSTRSLKSIGSFSSASMVKLGGNISAGGGKKQKRGKKTTIVLPG